MIAITFAIALTLAQSQSQSQSQDARPPLQQPNGASEWSDPLETTDARRNSPTTPQGLRIIQQFGACIADTSTAKAQATLGSDFTARTYRAALDRLVDANRGCPTSRGWSRLRTSRLLLAGAIAERLIERDQMAVNVQLARAAARPAAATYSPTDAGAMCVVRSVPDDVARLFATDVASPQEQQAAEPLRMVMGRCLQGRPVDITIDGLRSILATAAFRATRSAA